METLARRRVALARAMSEDARASFDELGMMLGLKAETLRRRARREGWAEPDAAAAGELNRMRLQRQLGYWINRMETLSASADSEDAKLDKAEIDAIASAIRAIEKMEELRQANMPDKKKNNDAEKAAVLRKVNQRIVELAHDYALHHAGDGGGESGAE